LFLLRRARGKLKYIAGSESGIAAWLNDPLARDDGAAAAGGWLVCAEKGSNPPARARETAPSRLNLICWQARRLCPDSVPALRAHPAQGRRGDAASRGVRLRSDAEPGTADLALDKIGHLGGQATPPGSCGRCARPGTSSTGRTLASPTPFR
jgi:hypothetical protein